MCTSIGTRPYWKFAAATLVGFVLSLTSTPAQAQDDECTEVFVFSGGEQEFLVPAGVTEITVNAFGAQGGSLPAGQNPGTGGLGAGVMGAVLTVTPGEPLQVFVGGKANDVGGPPNNPETPGGFNGGGDGGPLTDGTVHGGAGGGGASDVRRGGDRLVVAGGGGGGSHGGSGGDGGQTGLPGQDNQGTTDAQGGQGATEGGGGAGGAGDGADDGQAGTQFQGGAGGGNEDSIDAGGGGGGGFFGGGGGGGGTASAPGGGAGGGGGSSMGPPRTTFETGVREGDGSVEILYQQPGCGELAADLTVSKQATVNADNTVIFGIVVENLGPDDATGVVALDALPLCTQYLSDDCGGQVVGDEFRWEAGSLLSGGSATCNVTVDATDCAGEGPQTNTVTVEGELPDPDPENNEDTEEFEITVDTSSDLAITKTVSLSESTVVFGLEVTNLGPTTTAGVVANDELPECVVYQSDTCEGDPGPPFTWAIGFLGVGESVMCEITADAAGCEGQQTNTASVEGDDPDPNPANNEDEAVFDIEAGPSADLAIVKTATVTQNTVVFTLEVTNEGPSDTTGVAVNDALPECVVYQSDSCDGDPGPPFIWEIGSLAAGDSATCEITADAAGCEGQQTNTASVEGDDEDPNPDNNTDDADFEVGEEGEGADVSVTPGTTVHDDGTVDVEIDVTNDGPEDASGVEVTVTLPECAEHLSDDCNGQVGPPFTWMIGVLANDASASCTMTAEASSCEGEQTVVTEVTADQPDPEPDDNTAEDVFDIEVVPALPWLATVLLLLLLWVIATRALRRSRA